MNKDGILFFFYEKSHFKFVNRFSIRIERSRQVYLSICMGNSYILTELKYCRSEQIQ